MATVVEGKTELQQESGSKKHLRGSSLLLFGRLIALLLNFGVQVLTVRYLTKADYGAFAWALSIVAIGASVNLLGLTKTASRFIPIFEERRDYGSVVGTLVYAVTSIIGVGAAFVLLALATRSLWSGTLVEDARAAQIYVLVVALTPIQALDNLGQGLAAVFLGARAIFFRRHILGPLLKLLIILAVMGFGGSVFHLALGQLLAGSIGLAVYIWMLARVFRARRLFERSATEGIRIPTRKLLGFSLPLLTSDLVLVLQANIAVVALLHYHSTDHVAAFRAVLPVAGLNLVAIQSFKFLYVPLTSRLFARDDHGELSAVYWKTTLWISVLTFPVFAVTSFLADPVTLALFGERYADSGTLLAILAIGNYFSACLGLNAYTLQVYAKVRLILFANVATALLAVLYNVLLVPAYGPLGAALATTGAIFTHNILNHAALFLTTRIHSIPRGTLMAYGKILLACGVLALVASLDFASGAHWITRGVFASAVSVGLLLWNRGALDLSGTFPELGRIRALAWLTGTGGTS